MNATVFYVDEAEDIMCFLVDYPDKDEASQLNVVSEAMEVALQKYCPFVLCSLSYCADMSDPLPEYCLATSCKTH